MSNHTIRGSSVQEYARIIPLLHGRGWLWSSICDKHGDWLVSLDDDTPVDELHDWLTRHACSVDVIADGEFCTLIEDVPELRSIIEQPVVFSTDR